MTDVRLRTTEKNNVLEAIPQRSIQAIGTKGLAKRSNRWAIRVSTESCTRPRESERIVCARGNCLPIVIVGN